MKKTSYNIKELVKTNQLRGTLSKYSKVSLRDVKVLNIPYNSSPVVREYPLWNALTSKHYTTANTTLKMKLTSLKDHVIIQPIVSESIPSSSNLVVDIPLKQPIIIPDVTTETSSVVSLSQGLKPDTVSGISGIACIHKIKENPNNPAEPEVIYNEEALKFIPKIIAKFIWVTCSGPEITNLHDLFMRVIPFLNKDKGYEHTFYYPLAQHIIATVYARADVPQSAVIEMTEGLVDFSEFFVDNEPVKSITLLEGYFYKVVLKPFILKYPGKIKVYAQNEAVLQKNKDIEPYKTYQKESYVQTGQPNSDVRILINNDKMLLVKRFYRDTKAPKDPEQTLPLARGHISLSTTINKLFVIKRFKSDFKGSFQQKMVAVTKDKTTLKYDILQDEITAVNSFNASLESVVTSKEMTTDDKYEEVNEIQEEMLFHKDLKHVIPSTIALPPDNDPAITLILENSTEVAWMIQQITLDLANKETLQMLFPTTQKAHVEYWFTFMSNIISKMPPSPEKDVLKNNFEKIKLLDL